MIEFKAACGHTIRAKDEDAGKAVRCSYCGQEASVPDEREDQLDYLLNEVERTGDFEPLSAGKRRTSQPLAEGRAAASPRRQGGFDVFAIVMKMCYAAIIITVLIVAGRFGYRQWRALSQATPPAATGASGAANATNVSGETQNPPLFPGTVPNRGLLRPKLPAKTSGLYIDSVPPRATVYVRARPGSSGSILKAPDLRYHGPAGQLINLGPGTYEVAVVLKFQNLMPLPGFGDARRALENASTRDGAQGRVLNSYFLPDRAVRVEAQVLSDFSQAVVRYYEVEVIRNSWTRETALFLPRKLSLVELMGFLPSDKKYGFDVEAARTELAFREVPAENQPLILQALERIGMLPYRPKKSSYDERQPRYWLFCVSAMDGTVSSMPLR